MLDLACAECRKRCRLQHVSSWVDTRPFCSPACREAGANAVPAEPLDRNVVNALHALEACRTPLVAAMEHAHGARSWAARAAALRGDIDVPLGLGSMMGSSARAAAEEHAQAQVVAAMQMVGAYVFELEEHVRRYVCLGMGLHAKSVPIVQYLVPLSRQFSCLVVDPTRLDPAQVFGELESMNELFATTHRLVSTWIGRT